MSVTGLFGHSIFSAQMALTFLCLDYLECRRSRSNNNLPSRLVEGEFKWRLILLAASIPIVNTVSIPLCILVETAGWMGFHRGEDAGRFAVGTIFYFVMRVCVVVCLCFACAQPDLSNRTSTFSFLTVKILGSCADLTCAFFVFIFGTFPMRF